jgi:pimeloyl-ACP methyl ester carboxylesterase
LKRFAFAGLFAALFVTQCLQPAFADDGERLLSVDHYVRVNSTAPAIAGQTTEIYAREIVQASTGLRQRGLGDRVVLFIHGAGTPAEVSFDVGWQDYSWMAFLARDGFDVFAMDMTGYGRSTRPGPMNDPCNLSHDQQLAFVPALLTAPCSAPAPAGPITTIASDWNDIGAVVDHILALRHVEKVNLVAWSQGGPRAGGYAAQHPEKVNKMVLLAPAYNRAGPDKQPAPGGGRGAMMTTQSHAEFAANWDRQAGCPAQYDQAASDAVWAAMLDSDPVGATWGTGVRRAPSVPSWGWNAAVVAKTMIPTLMVSGQHDKQVAPANVRNLYADIGSPRKVFVDLACSSHNAMWEKNHLLLFNASLEWLTKGTVSGKEQAELRLGY